MHAIIMAGGSGTRFWPSSRKSRPKQFLNISGKSPMLIETCDRLKPVIPDKQMIIVLGQGHLKEALDLFKGRGTHIVAEPVGRNTAPCIGLGAIYARYLGCDKALAFLPADHFIGKPQTFLNSLEQAGEVAESGGIVTLGIIPSRRKQDTDTLKKRGPIRLRLKQQYLKSQPLWKNPTSEKLKNTLQPATITGMRAYSWPHVIPF